MHGLLRWNIKAGVHAHVRGADVSLRDVTIAEMGNRVTECGWRHAPEARGGFWEILKKVSRVETRHQTRRLTFACSRRPWSGAARDGGDRWKSRNWKIVPLSPYVEKPLNSKVIKSFVPELRSRKCFSCFEIQCSMWYMYIFYEHYISTSHIRIGIWYKWCFLTYVKQSVNLACLSLYPRKCPDMKLRFIES